MIHNPCADDPNMLCRRHENRCRFFFPKAFQEETTYVGENRSPVYRRRQNPPVIVRGMSVDNRYVVPYNPTLTMLMKSHINVEVQNPGMGVRYLYKYLHKGVDHETVAFNVAEDGRAILVNHDEGTSYQQGRYLSSSDAYWNLACFLKYQNSHVVFRLPIHLPGGQTILFEEGMEKEAIRREATQDTKLTAFFRLNRVDRDASAYTYVQLPLYYTWHQKEIQWHKRLRGGHNFIVRIADVPPRYGELYYLRLLLHHIKGPASFEHVRTVNGIVHETFRSACVAYGLLASDSNYISTLTEAARLRVPLSLRQLFVHIVVYCRPNDVPRLYAKFEEEMLHDWMRVTGSATRARCVVQTLIAKYFSQLEANPGEYGITLEDAVNPEQCPELLAITKKDAAVQLATVNFNKDQQSFFDAVQASINREERHSKGSRAYFLDGPAGTGKTYTLNALIRYASAKGPVAVAAWSGIAASLLSGGVRVHSLLKLPFDLNNTSAVGLHLQSMQALLLIESSLIILDEVSMANKHAERAMDVFLKEATGNSGEVFCGKTVVLASDFRQILLVVKRESPTAEIVKKFPLWSSVKHMQLTQNLRMKDDQQYAQFVLNIGNGIESQHVCIPAECGVNSFYELIRDTLGIDFHQMH